MDNLLFAGNFWIKCSSQILLVANSERLSVKAPLTDQDNT